MTSPTPNGFGEAVDDGSITSLIQQYEQYKIFDAVKSAYFDGIVQRLKFVSEQLTEERAHFDQERKWIQQNFMALNQKDVVLKNLVECEPFVLVLIDGNDLIFRNSLLRDGDMGGRRAAQALFQAVNEYAFSTIDDLPHTTKVVVRVFVDIEDLCNVCLRAGVVNHANKVKTFVRGFCQDKSLFDLIDVGMQGRAIVYDKMEDNLKLHIFDIHCKHILFGCSDGEVYARVLRRFAESANCKNRLTLICGTIPDKDLASLQLETTQITTIFRNTKVETHKVIDFVSDMDPPPASFGISNGMNAMTPPSSTPTTSRSNSRLAQEGAGFFTGHSRQVSVTSSSGSSDVQVPQAKPKSKPGSWAFAAQKGALVVATPPPPPPPKVSSKESDSTVRRNKKGQRIDPPNPEFRKDDVNRLKKLKLCNAHHLRNDCPYPNEKCTHDHNYKPSKSELETLRLVARMSACIHGSECEDVKCIYGHRCPFPEAREGGMRGKGCINGENCRFPSHMHGMDTCAARLTKIS